MSTKKQTIVNDGARPAGIDPGLESAIAGYQAETLSSAQLKPFLAPYGIYEQRNAEFMLRVRITGGHIETDDLRNLAAIMDRNSIPLAHLSSRQAVQLHDVAAGKIVGTMVECRDAGLPFKGGGGNTYRNILISPDSGLACDEAFDVYPYALAIHRVLAQRPDALVLPRKFKVGVFAKPSEAFLASVQDLGFVAMNSGGKRGFTVYGGGGLGRESGVGIKLFDFLPQDQFIRCTLAMLQLFSDQGDRENRHKARLRFVLKSRGAEDFARLFTFYFEKTPWECPVLPPAPDYGARDGGSAGPSAGKRHAAGFEAWRLHAVAPTRFGAGWVSVRLYVPYGNLTSGHLTRLARMADEFGRGFFRLMRSQDLLLGPVAVASLPKLYERLMGEFPELDLTLRSFRGHITTCVGAAVCKIGILSSPTLADAIADKLDFLLPATTPETRETLRQITDDILISGCPNSCSGHPTARLGFQGQKQRIGDTVEDVVLPFTGRSLDPESLRLATTSDATPAIPVNRLPAAIARALGIRGKE